MRFVIPKNLKNVIFLSFQINLLAYFTAQHTLIQAFIEILQNTAIVVYLNSKNIHQLCSLELF